ncbi:hypothetical protein C5167_008870 [Papaver somniferum]|uniref:Uncharacterized protein n=1 Tax=Papaver somniferum TaxID=3469 RepID=A0A4Y7JZP3_PAPSO|nr:hypothetical protein C5167_008870 [Papaver somniferum]
MMHRNLIGDPNQARQCKFLLVLEVVITRGCVWRPGAFGCTINVSGPTVVAITDGEKRKSNLEPS